MTNMTVHAKPRGNNRRRVLKAGVIAHNGRHVTMACGIRDMSDAGARLCVEGSIEPPDTFELLIDVDGLEAECAVVWRRGREVGVRFSEPPRPTGRKRPQVIDTWAMTSTKPSLRRQPKR